MDCQSIVVESIISPHMIKQLGKDILAPVLASFRPCNVVMFHIGRCGSTVVSTLLDQHPNLYWASELYEPFFKQWRINNAGVEVVGEMPADAIEILRKSSRQAIHHFYGFEMKPYHFRLIGYAQDDFLQHLKAMGFTHYIILDRKNRLRKIISSIIAHQKGSYHNHGETRARLKSVYVNLDKVEIDFDSKPLLDYLRDYDKQFSVLESSLKSERLLELTYEDDIQDDPEIAYSSICEFLDIERKPVSVNLSKTNPFPVRDMIENLEEVEQVLSGTPYEWMLNG